MTNIRYNHGCITESARLGSDIAIHVATDSNETYDGYCYQLQAEAGDSADAINQGEKTMLKIKVGAVEFACDEQLHQALTAQFTAMDAKVAELQKQADAAQAKVDAAAADQKKMKEALDSATDKAKVRESMRARLALEKTVEEICGKVEGMDAKDDVELKKLVVKKVYPTVALDEKSEAYVDASFDRAVDTRTLFKSNEGVKHFAAAFDSAVAAGNKTEQEALDEKEKASKEKFKNMWRETLAAQK